MYGNGRPLGMRKRMQVVVAVVLLAWATQTLLRQWGFGAEIPPAEGVEKFVPGSDRPEFGSVLEMRGDASIIGSEVRLRQVCRWSEADAPFFAPVADLVLARLDGGSPFRSIGVDQIRRTLRDAGMNVGAIRFAGPVACTISRTDVAYDEQSALRQWAAAKGGASTVDATASATDSGASAINTVAPAAAPISAPAEVHRPAPERSASGSTRTLRSMLLDDLSVRLGVPVDQLEVTFNPKDTGLLNLSQPLFQFNIEPRSIHDLGHVSWNILVVTGSGSQKGVIEADARQWQNHMVVVRPLGYHQVIRAEDVEQRRILADRLPYEALLNSSQVIGQQAARDLPVGTVITARLVDAVALVRPGQLVTVSLSVGTVRVKTVARAMEEGSYGRTVKVRNESTQDVYEVTMVAPQVGVIGPMQ